MTIGIVVTLIFRFGLSCYQINHLFLSRLQNTEEFRVHQTFHNKSSLEKRLDMILLNKVIAIWVVLNVSLPFVTDMVFNYIKIHMNTFKPNERETTLTPYCIWSKNSGLALFSSRYLLHLRLKVCTIFFVISACKSALFVGHLFARSPSQYAPC